MYTLGWNREMNYYLLTAMKSMNMTVITSGHWIWYSIRVIVNMHSGYPCPYDQQKYQEFKIIAEDLNGQAGSDTFTLLRRSLFPLD